MKLFHATSAVLFGLFLIGLVNGFDFDDFPRHRTPITHGLFDNHPSHAGFWPFTHTSFFPPLSRRTAEDDDSSEEVVAEPGNSEPLDVDTISGSINNPDDVHAEIETHHHTDPFSTFDPTGLFFHQSFNPFANPFGAFNGMIPRQQPWWRGPNVCTQRQEDIEDIQGANDSGEEKNSNGQTFHFGVHLTLNSCVERSHKHVCKSVVNENGKTKTVSITRQCCHGYGRQNDADVSKTCEKLNLVSVMETSEKLGAKEFVKTAKNNGLEDMLTKKNVTVFLPTDASFSAFSEQMLESNLVVIPQVARRRRSAEQHDYLSGFNSKDLALNHIVDDWIDIQDIENEQILQTQKANKKKMLAERDRSRKRNELNEMNQFNDIYIISSGKFDKKKHKRNTIADISDSEHRNRRRKTHGKSTTAPPIISSSSTRKDTGYSTASSQATHSSNEERHKTVHHHQSKDSTKSRSKEKRHNSKEKRSKEPEPERRSAKKKKSHRKKRSSSEEKSKSTKDVEAFTEESSDSNESSSYEVVHEKKSHKRDKNKKKISSSSSSTSE